MEMSKNLVAQTVKNFARKKGLAEYDLVLQTIACFIISKLKGSIEECGNG